MRVWHSPYGIRHDSPQRVPATVTNTTLRVLREIRDSDTCQKLYIPEVRVYKYLGINHVIFL